MSTLMTILVIPPIYRREIIAQPIEASSPPSQPVSVLSPLRVAHTSHSPIDAAPLHPETRKMPTPLVRTPPLRALSKIVRHIYMLQSCIQISDASHG